MMALFFILVFLGAAAAPEFTAQSVSNSIELCIKVIIPSLFIFTVISDFLVKKNAFRMIGELFSGFGNYLGVGGEGIAIFLVGLLCGFPIGAKLAVGLYDREEISKKNAEYLILFTNNTSLGFIFSVVASSVSNEGAWIIFVSQLISAVIIALMFKSFLGIKKSTQRFEVNGINTYFFSQSIKSGAQTMVGICAAIIIYSFLGDAVQAVLNKDMIYIGVLMPVKGFFEFSSGIIASKEIATGIYPAAFFSCFGGLAVYGQIKSITGNKLSTKFYLLAKFLQGIIGTIITVILIIGL